MKTKPSTLKTVALALGLIIAGAGTLPAALVISDTFTRTGDLNSSSPDVGSTWTTNGATFTTDGSLLNISTSYREGYISFTPTVGMVYTLSADLDATSGGDWLAIGFDGTTPSDPTSSSGAWALLKLGGAVEAFSNNVSNQFSTGTGTGAVDNLKLTLDTTPADWTVSLFINNVASGTYTYSGGNPSIGSVFVGAGNVTGTVDNFTLDAVPEPSSAVMLLGGAGMFLGLRRRKLAA